MSSLCGGASVSLRHALSAMSYDWSNLEVTYILGMGNLIDMAIHRDSLFADTTSILQVVV